MRHEDKRRLRKLKREIKRLGTKRRRQYLKRELKERPEDAPFSQFDFDRCTSTGLNGLDNDRMRDSQQSASRSSQRRA